MEQLSQTPPTRGPRHVLARAGALTLSLGVVALLMIQAGLPGCFAADPPIQPEPRSADTPQAQPAPPAPAAPGAAANDPASPAPPSPAPAPAAEEPALADPAAPSKGSKNHYFPGSKAPSYIPLDPPPQQQQAPSPPPQPAKPKGKP